VACMAVKSDMGTTVSNRTTLTACLTERGSECARERNGAERSTSGVAWWHCVLKCRRVGRCRISWSRALRHVAGARAVPSSARSRQVAVVVRRRCQVCVSAPPLELACRRWIAVQVGAARCSWWCWWRGWRGCTSNNTRRVVSNVVNRPHVTEYGAVVPPARPERPTIAHVVVVGVAFVAACDRSGRHGGWGHTRYG
jgi:hypothetical protein